MARIEFYDDERGPHPFAAVDDGAVPHVGEFINIQKKTYCVRHLSWALDYADDPARCMLRANVDVYEVDEQGS